MFVAFAGGSAAAAAQEGVAVKDRASAAKTGVSTATVAGTPSSSGRKLCLPDEQVDMPVFTEYKRKAEKFLAQLSITVPLDNTGIANFAFLNPRNPFGILRPKEPGEQAAEFIRACGDTLIRPVAVKADGTTPAKTEDPLVRVFLQNRTADRTFEVRLDGSPAPISVSRPPTESMRLRRSAPAPIESPLPARPGNVLLIWSATIRTVGRPSDRAYMLSSSVIMVVWYERRFSSRKSRRLQPKS